ncbi:hypothetical protein Dimus_013834 [Dionaea muscipula]
MARDLLRAVKTTRRGESSCTRVAGEGGQCSKSVTIDICRQNWRESVEDGFRLSSAPLRAPPLTVRGTRPISLIEMSNLFNSYRLMVCSGLEGWVTDDW